MFEQIRVCKDHCYVSRHTVTGTIAPVFAIGNVPYKIFRPQTDNGLKHAFHSWSFENLLRVSKWNSRRQEMRFQGIQVKPYRCMSWAAFSSLTSSSKVWVKDERANLPSKVLYLTCRRISGLPLVAHKGIRPSIFLYDPPDQFVSVGLFFNSTFSPKYSSLINDGKVKEVGRWSGDLSERLLNSSSERQKVIIRNEAIL